LPGHRAGRIRVGAGEKRVQLEGESIGVFAGGKFLLVKGSGREGPKPDWMAATRSFTGPGRVPTSGPIMPPGLVIAGPVALSPPDGMPKVKPEKKITPRQTRHRRRRPPTLQPGLAPGPLPLRGSRER
jgi:hypothetical protein